MASEISKMKGRGKLDRLLTMRDDPDDILTMKGKVDKALAMFHVRTCLVFSGAKLNLHKKLSASIDMSKAIEDTIKKGDINSLSKTIVAKTESVLGIFSTKSCSTGLNSGICTSSSQDTASHKSLSIG